MWCSQPPKRWHLSDRCSSVLGSGFISWEQEILWAVRVHRVHSVGTQPPIVKIRQLLWSHGHRTGKKVHVCLWSYYKCSVVKCKLSCVQPGNFRTRSISLPLWDSAPPLKGPWFISRPAFWASDISLMLLCQIILELRMGTNMLECGIACL